MKHALPLVFAIAPLFGQLQTVDMRVSGLDCASCAESINRRLSRLRGVESASFDPQKNTVALKLKPENTVTLAAIRDALKSLGYTPGDATIAARGTLRSGVLALPHQERAFVVESATGDGPITLTGTVAASKPGESDQLRIASKP